MSEDMLFLGAAILLAERLKASGREAEPADIFRAVANAEQLQREVERRRRQQYLDEVEKRRVQACID